MQIFLRANVSPLGELPTELLCMVFNTPEKRRPDQHTPRQQDTC